MSAGLYNFTIEQGTYFKRIFTWRNQDGSAIDITGYTPKMQIRTVRDKLILDCSGKLTVLPLQGKVTLVLHDDVTAALDFDTAKYDLKLVGAEPRRLIKGQVTLDKAITVDG